jgi:hypothetical protein
MAALSSAGFDRWDSPAGSDSEGDILRAASDVFRDGGWDLAFMYATGAKEASPTSILSHTNSFFREPDDIIVGLSMEPPQHVLAEQLATEKFFLYQDKIMKKSMDKVFESDDGRPVFKYVGRRSGGGYVGNPYHDGKTRSPGIVGDTQLEVLIHVVSYYAKKKARYGYCANARKFITRILGRDESDSAFHYGMTLDDF